MTERPLNTPHPLRPARSEPKPLILVVEDDQELAKLIAQTLEEAGMQTQGPPPFDAKAKQRFAARLDSLLTRALRGTRS